MFVVTTFRYFEFLFHIVDYWRGKENRSLHRGLRYKEVRILYYTIIDVGVNDVSDDII